MLSAVFPLISGLAAAVAGGATEKQCRRPCCRARPSLLAKDFAVTLWVHLLVIVLLLGCEAASCGGMKPGKMAANYQCSGSTALRRKAVRDTTYYSLGTQFYNGGYRVLKHAAASESKYT
jgi:hypothetical protein